MKTCANVFPEPAEGRCCLTAAERIRMGAWATLLLALSSLVVWPFARIAFFGWQPEPDLTLDYFVVAHFGFEISVLGCVGGSLALIRAVFRPRWAVKLHNYFYEKVVSADRLGYALLFGWFFTWVLFGGMAKTFDMLK